jgi:hypothetical protein
MTATTMTTISTASSKVGAVAAIAIAAVAVAAVYKRPKKKTTTTTAARAGVAPRAKNRNSHWPSRTECAWAGNHHMDCEVLPSPPFLPPRPLLDSSRSLYFSSLRLGREARRIAMQDGWVVQLYIDRPLLVKGRKFDIRCFVLVLLQGQSKARPAQMQGFFYRDAYVRTSSKKVCDFVQTVFFYYSSPLFVSSFRLLFDSIIFPYSRVSSSPL